MPYLNVRPKKCRPTEKRWMDWIGGIAAQNKLTDVGSSLFPGGNVVKAGNVIADGPYTEVKECLIGYSIVKALSIEDATALAKGCPVLEMGGNVEVREISSIGG